MELGLKVLEFVKNVREPRPWELEIERTRFKPTPKETGTKESL
jgi:hypothetical protein